ncbi:MAG: SMP-30/gluconolactonase/LRE family protein [Novosphingobium sp.]|nr:SMP-30/gluconolactonase/LRE family protein [Novosphingobium sp.]
MTSELKPGEFRNLASGIYLEGLTVDYARNMIWYSDVISGGVHGAGFDGAPHPTLNPERMWTGGIMMNADGAVLSSGQGGIMWNNPDTGKSGWLIDTIDGVRVNGINEMMPDGIGGMWFGTVDIEMIEQGKDARPAKIYRLAADGTVTLAAEGLGFANGIMMSADGKQLFYNDTFDATYAFDIGSDMTLSNKRKLLDKYDCDGMALDAEGNLWLTGFQSGHFERITPNGDRLPPVQTPEHAITQIRFGGPDMRDYVFTSVPADGGDSLKEGKPLTARHSYLYRGRSEVPGMRIEPTQFTLG